MIFFNYIVYREGKGYKYGFMPRDYIPDEMLQSFQQFRIESENGARVKNEEEEEEKKKVNTTTAAATSEEGEDEEDPITDIDLTNLD